MLEQVSDPIKPLLEEYLLLSENKLPGFISAFYLEGSIALGAFNERLSDIDFIAFISRGWTEYDLVDLKEIHRTIETTYPHWPLQGSYLQWEVLAQPENPFKPHLTYHEGRLRQGKQLDLNGVDWWVLKNRGLTLRGPQTQSLEFQVDWQILLTNMKHNLNNYWAAYTYKPNRVAWLFTDYGIQWVVLGVLRQYYTFKEQDITSKIGAGEYALAYLPPKWHRLIQEAINIREQPHTTLYKFRVDRAIEAYRFLRYLLHSVNNLF